MSLSNTTVTLVTFHYCSLTEALCWAIFTIYARLAISAGLASIFSQWSRGALLPEAKGFSSNSGTITLVQSYVCFAVYLFIMQHRFPILRDQMHELLFALGQEIVWMSCIMNLFTWKESHLAHNLLPHLFSQSYNYTFKIVFLSCYCGFTNLFLASCTVLGVIETARNCVHIHVFSAQY